MSQSGQITSDTSTLPPPTPPPHTSHNPILTHELPQLLRGSVGTSTSFLSRQTYFDNLRCEHGHVHELTQSRALTPRDHNVVAGLTEMAG